ncbi:MAG TPA: efflux RND transporter periplasmic adaptor subunit [Alkalispirochaeta sp.]|nr:efflux RND transporter periplasmic adaptor subunit [Alkalispirochaeta sp.]
MRTSYRSAGRRLLTVAAAILIVTLAACSPGEGPGGGQSGQDENGGAEQATGAQNVDSVFAVNVTPAVQGEINDYIEINGDVQTTASVDVFSDTNGEVVRLYIGVGQTVQAGETIAEVDPSRPGQNFALSPVRAPITGTITRLPARVGAQVAPSAPVAQISRTTDLEIVVDVAERFISKVSRGLPAVVSLDAFPERTFNATVTDLSPVVDPLTRTLQVTLRFDRPDPVIRAGMFAEVRIITEQKDNIVKVPSDVLIRRFGDTFVYVVTEDNTAERRIVNSGIEIDDKIEITEGLAPNERVVYQGQNLLEDGSRVRVIDTITPLTVEDTVR